jgi:uncharacterized protein (DUF2235 family)
MAAKNIIVCADGTGNKGGYSPDSNVYKIYNAVDKNFSGKAEDGTGVSEQIIFYDNGVGTHKNKYLRAIGGALGFGFGRNVRDLYKFLARNYVEGDRIYFFGFSRGASTVRACNGMINKCGLAKGAGLRNRELDDLVHQAFNCYKRHKKDPASADNLKNSDSSHGAVPIHFLGIWDTVVALGFPKRTDITGAVNLILNSLFWVFEEVLDLIWPHNFYHYKLTDNVEYACQALSIDDERTAFWPFVWREKNIEGAADRTTDNVEQVWFAGMHSNVGGGYERAGMSGVALHWMLNLARHHGLVFDANDLDDVYSACHIHGRMYNSRDGFGIMYRYHPREIEDLCKDRLLGDIKIHCSVIERLNHRTANYAPGYIPAEFEVVDSAVPSNTVQLNPGKNKDWAETRSLIDKTVLSRKHLYGAMLASIVSVIAAALYFKNDSQPAEAQYVLLDKVAGFFYSMLPDFFTGLINAVVVRQPYYLLAALILIILYLKVRRILHMKTVRLCETLRHYIIHAQEHQLTCKNISAIKEENS